MGATEAKERSPEVWSLVLSVLGVSRLVLAGRRRWAERCFNFDYHPLICTDLIDHLCIPLSMNQK